jgi:hypothetical protein
MITRRSLACAAALVVALAAASAQQDAPGAAPAEPTTAMPPWRWTNDKREPFLEWHTNAAIQQQAYDEAYAAMRAATGLELAGRVDVAIVPLIAFPFIAMESGAKTGALKHSHTLTKALDWLGFAPEGDRNRGVSGDEMAERAAKGPPLRGIYFPRVPAGGGRSRELPRQVFVCEDVRADDLVNVLRHELAHALQDTAIDFSTWVDTQHLDLDVFLARFAVVEGTAMLLANPQELHVALERAANVAGGCVCLDATGKLTPYSLTHIAGGDFARQVRDTVADDAALVSALFREPPATTREILRPDLYLAGRERMAGGGAPAGVPSEDFAADPDFTRLVPLMKAGVEAAKWERPDATVGGAFLMLSVLVELGVPCAEAAAMAEHWRADQLLTADMKRGNRHPCVVACSTWVLDSDEAAATLAGAIETALAGRGAGAPIVKRDASPRHATRWFQPEDRDLAHVLIERRGHCVVYAAGEDVGPLAERLAADG